MSTESSISKTTHKPLDFDNYEMIRNADIQVEKYRNASGRTEAGIIINDRFEHRFNSGHAVSKSLDMMKPEQLAERLTGGSYFMVNEQLVDYRDGVAIDKHFVHSDDSIARLVDVLGFYEPGRQSSQRTRSTHERQASTTNIEMGTVWDETEFGLPFLHEGGDFSSRLLYNWSPFVSYVKASYEIVRLLCVNGMIGTTQIFTPKIPLINQWEHHLNIATRQIQNTIEEKVNQSIHRLIETRAPVNMCRALHELINARLDQPLDPEERMLLLGVRETVNPYTNLEKFYTTKAIDSDVTGGILPSHLTGYDLYNMITEVNTHSRGCKKASVTKLNEMANTLMFEPTVTLGYADMTAVSGALAGMQSANVRLASFSNPEQAFFGELVI